MQKAAIYARLSTDRDLNAASIDVQVTACREEAERRGLTVPAAFVFVDRNLSASKRGTVRPGYDALLGALASGEVTTVIVRETSRLYRRPAELETLLELVEGKDVKVVALFSGDIDLDRGLLEARIRVAVDAEETHKLSQRVRLAKAARRAEGAHNGGGRRPYGYQRVPGGLIIDAAEAARVREAAQRILAGEALTRVCADWNGQGLLTAGGTGRWRPSHLRRILGGTLSKHRSTPFAAGGRDWPAILKPAEVKLLQARFAQVSRFAPKAPATGRKYALTGLLVCDSCGSKLIGSGGYYRCATVNGGCGKVGIKSRDLEDYLAQSAFGRPPPGEVTPVTPVPDSEREKLLVTLSDVEDRLVQVGEAIADGTLSITTGSAAEAGLVQRRDAVQAQLAQTIPAGPPMSWDERVADSMDWHDRWVAGELTDVELSDLRQEFGAYISEVRIAPRPDRRHSFNPDRLAVCWQPGA